MSRYYVLEDNVPLPPITRHTAAGMSRYPFETMEVGQSFLVPHESGASAAVLAVQYAKQRGRAWRFATRVTNEGLRVWRLPPIAKDQAA